MGLAAPDEHEFLNFEENYFQKYERVDGDILIGVEISLSRKVVYQKRIVYDLFMMFGDVGGLNDFLILGLEPIFAFLSGKFMLASVLERLFLVSPDAKA